ncbi:MAG TPA: DUF4350 domain-containing protein [Kofleriaceae bacterium]|nr:DUF4350 domain-containing protein [Kofleriaceae bacterium]
MGRKGLMACLCLFGLIAADPARAQDIVSETGADYATDNRGWNGLSTFVALCRGLGLEVVSTSAFNWKEIEDGDVLVLFYPTGSIPGSEIATFVRDGGHLVIADDFGTAGKLLARLGILRRPADVAAGAPHYAALPYAPIARATGDHPLAHGIDHLVTNHPAALAGGGTSVFALPGDQGVVIAADFGRGRVVAISDPSMVINRMLELSDNLQFAINLVRYLTTADTHRVVIASGDFVVYGWPEPHRIADPAERFADRANAALYGTGDYLLTGAGAKWAAVFGAAILSVAVLWVLPLVRRPVASENFTRIARRKAAAPVDENGRPRLDLAAAIVRDSVNQSLATVVGVADPLAQLSDRALITAVLRALPEAEPALAEILPLLRKVLPRGHSTHITATAVSQREFDRLTSGAAAFHRSLKEHV